MADEMEFTILPDGRAVVTTDEISMPNHLNAENILRFIATETGVKATRRARTDVKKHDHKHHSHQKS